MVFALLFVISMFLFVSLLWMPGWTFVHVWFPSFTVSETHQEVGGTEDPQSGAADLNLRCEDSRSQDKSESKDLNFVVCQCQMRWQCTWHLELYNKQHAETDVVCCQHLSSQKIMNVLCLFCRMCSTTVSYTGYPSVQTTKRIKEYLLSSAKTRNPTNTSATCLTVKSV